MNQIEWYNAYRWNRYLSDLPAIPFSEDSPFNPPPNQYLTDFRWTLSAEKEHWLFLATPRLEANHASETGWKEDLFFQDAYAQWMNPNHQIRLGVQTFQWGPAELLSPSNPIFHFDQRQRWFFYRQRGRGLAKWNWNLSSNWTLSTVSEFFQASKETFIEDEKFQPSGLLKLEYRSDSGQNYLGITGGITPEQHPFIGEYFAYYLTDAFSVYADARHTQGDSAYRPVTQSSGVELQQTNKECPELETFSAAGLRFESRADFRIEYIYNQKGLSKDQWLQTLFAISGTNPAYQEANLKKFDQSGQEVPGTDLLYLSMRISDLGASKAYTIFLRDLHSLVDDSGDFQASLERTLGKSLTLYGEITAFYGKRDSFFGSLLSQEGLLGIKWSH